jgi:hypothetical protein
MEEGMENRIWTSDMAATLSAWIFMMDASLIGG